MNQKILHSLSKLLLHLISSIRRKTRMNRRHHACLDADFFFPRFGRRRGFSEDIQQRLSDEWLGPAAGVGSHPC
jgi:hypothetical protein